MRSIIAVASLLALLFVLGCNHLVPHQRGDQAGGPREEKVVATPTVEGLVKYLNENASHIQPGTALNCTNVTIDINADGRNVGISAMMQCQAPRNFMMSGLALGNPVVEIGSNNKEFWFWSSQIKPAYLYHCSYDSLSQGVKVPFPFQPDMVLNALGLAPYDPAKQYTVQMTPDNRGHKLIELTEHTRSPENKPIQKITVFNPTVVQAPTPQVVAHILKDEQGKVICAAHIRSAQRVGDNGPIIPRIVDFNWPEQKMKMTMTLYNPRFVAMPADKAVRVFNRQNLRYQSFDLAAQALDGSGVQQTSANGVIIRR